VILIPGKGTYTMLVYPARIISGQPTVYATIHDRYRKSRQLYFYNHLNCRSITILFLCRIEHRSTAPPLCGSCIRLQLHKLEAAHDPATTRRYTLHSSALPPTITKFLLDLGAVDRTPSLVSRPYFVSPRMVLKCISQS
jgi:hypothetical protein